MFLNKKISSSLIKLLGKFTPLGYACKAKFETTPIFNRFITYFDTISWISTTGYVGNFQMINNKAWLPRIYSTQGLTGYNTLDGENLTGFGVK